MRLLKIKQQLHLLQHRKRNKRMIRKHYIFYSVSIILILALAFIAIYSYDQYIGVKRFQHQKYDEKMERIKNQNIKLLNYLKFSHPHHINDDDGMSLFLIETIKIDNSGLRSDTTLHPTVVRTPQFYYHLTTIDGIDLPHFAVFCFFRDLSHSLFTTFSARKIAANWGRIRLFTLKASL